MNLHGSRQIGPGKKLLEQYPWQRFQPHPEWAAFANRSGGLRMRLASHTLGPVKLSLDNLPASLQSQRQTLAHCFEAMAPPDAIRQTESAIRLWVKTAKEDGLEIPRPRGRLVYA